ncbi:hypothetical protein L5220_07815 [Synechococcus sp. PCC 6716]|nr:hypothetical protein [Synechococcus sp. PCC 6716]
MRVWPMLSSRYWSDIVCLSGGAVWVALFWLYLIWQGDRQRWLPLP